MATPPPTPLAARDHLRVRRGSTLFRTYQWDEGGVPVDLTGWTATFKARDKGGLLQIDLMTTAGVVLNADGVIGRVDIDAGVIEPPGDDFQVWAFELRLSTPAGQPGYLAGGEVEVFGSATTGTGGGAGDDGVLDGGFA